MAVICVDAGTSVVKAVAYSDSGKETMVADIRVGIARPKPGWAEQDMNTVWAAVVKAVRQLTDVIGASVDFIATTSQGDGLWLVDSDGQPVGPAILWNDARARSVVTEWGTAVSEEAFRLNGSAPFSGSAAALLTWLKRNKPRRIDDAAATLSCNGWLFSRMTGRIAIDCSDASNPFLDLANGEWSDELVALYGLGWARRLLPPLLDDRTGTLSPTAAESLGLAPATTVVMAPYDVAATAAGCGVTASGQANVILGTSICTQVGVDHPTFDGAPIGTTLVSGIDDLYLRVLPTSAGGDVATLITKLVGLGTVSELLELASHSPPGAKGLLFLPHLSPAGERAPFVNPYAWGGFIGLSLEHTQADMARSVLEGLSYIVSDCLQALENTTTTLHVAGGGASPIWLQLISDITGRSILANVDRQSGARGAFLAGLVATGKVSSFVEGAEQHVVHTDLIHPNQNRVDLYKNLCQPRADLCVLMQQNGAQIAEFREAVGGFDD